MTDQELVVAAAEAVGIKSYNINDSGILWADELPGNLSGAWDPLGDDGDAFRLAAKLHIEITYPINILDGRPGTVSACAVGYPGLRAYIERERPGGDWLVRRAIVEAAAKLAKVK